MTKYDWGWLVGLLEGEGCFLLATTKAITKSGRVTYFHPRIDLVSTDKDTVARAAKLMGTSYRCSAGAKTRPQDPYPRKPLWKTSAYSLRALDLMELMLPLMSKHRRQQIKDVLKTRNAVRNRPWGKRHAV